MRPLATAMAWCHPQWVIRVMCLLLLCCPLASQAAAVDFDAIGKAFLATAQEQDTNNVAEPAQDVAGRPSVLKRWLKLRPSAQLTMGLQREWRVRSANGRLHHFGAAQMQIASAKDAAVLAKRSNPDYCAHSKILLRCSILVRGQEVVVLYSETPLSPITEPLLLSLQEHVVNWWQP